MFSGGNIINLLIGRSRRVEGRRMRMRGATTDVSKQQI